MPSIKHSRIFGLILRACMTWEAFHPFSCACSHRCLKIHVFPISKGKQENICALNNLYFNWCFGKIMFILFSPAGTQGQDPGFAQRANSFDNSGWQLNKPEHMELLLMDILKYWFPSKNNRDVRKFYGRGCLFIISFISVCSEAYKDDPKPFGSPL